MPPVVSQKVISISDNTRKDLSDISTLAKLEEIKLHDSTIIAWGLKTLRDSIIEMKNNGIKLKPIFLDATKLKNHKTKKNKFMEDQNSWE